MSKSRQLIEKLVQKPYSINVSFPPCHENTVDSIFSRLGVIKNKKLYYASQDGDIHKMMYYLVEFPSKEIAKAAIDECPPEKRFVLGSRRETNL